MIAYSPTLGVYLGQCMGLGFWSKLDFAGQEEACTWKNAEDFQEFSENWITPPPEDLRFLGVNTDKHYATHDECVMAGADPWLSPSTYLN
jgi:hypothetical protein